MGGLGPRRHRLRRRREPGWGQGPASPRPPGSRLGSCEARAEPKASYKLPPARTRRRGSALGGSGQTEASASSRHCADARRRPAGERLARAACCGPRKDRGAGPGPPGFLGPRPGPQAPRPSQAELPCVRLSRVRRIQHLPRGRAERGPCRRLTGSPARPQTPAEDALPVPPSSPISSTPLLVPAYLSSRFETCVRWLESFSAAMGAGGTDHGHRPQPRPARPAPRALDAPAAPPLVRRSQALRWPRGAVATPQSSAGAPGAAARRAGAARHLRDPDPNSGLLPTLRPGKPLRG